jgi:Holliday junction resolvase
VEVVKSRHHHIRISDAEAAVLLRLARRLRDDPALATQLNPAELVVVTNLVDVLGHANVTS